jgi:hypothetical protein
LERLRLLMPPVPSRRGGRQIEIDGLRPDVFSTALEAGELPNIARLPGGREMVRERCLNPEGAADMQLKQPTCPISRRAL